MSLSTRCAARAIGQTVAIVACLWMATGIKLAGAGPLDDLKNSLGQSLSDTAKKAVDSALGNASNGSGASPGAPSQGTPSGSISPGAAGTMSFSHGAVTCISEAPHDRAQKAVTNTCQDPIWFIKAYDSGKCFMQTLKPGKTTYESVGVHIKSSCRIVRGANVSGYECSCPSGTEITASSGSSVIEGGPKVKSNDFPTSPSGCPMRKDDPRWRDIPKGDRCTM